MKKSFYILLLFAAPALLQSCADEPAESTTNSANESASSVTHPFTDSTLYSLLLEEVNMGDEIYTDFSLQANGRLKELGERLGHFTKTDTSDTELKGLIDENASEIYKCNNNGITNIVFMVQNDSQVIVTEGIRDENQKMMYNELMLLDK